MIAAKAVGCKARGRWLLRGVELACAPGELLAIVGPNGAGKSTLLKLLSGERAPSEGRVELGGRDLTQWRRREMARARAVMPQSAPLDFPLTVTEVVMLGRSPYASTPESAQDLVAVEQAMIAADIAHLSVRIYTQLSGGERQRVQLARALAQLWGGSGPRVLMLDEPTASLDIAHAHQVLQVAAKTASDGAAVLCVVHDLGLAAQYASRIAVLAEGAVVADGRPADVLTTEMLRRVFNVEASILAHPMTGSPVVVAHHALNNHASLTEHDR